MINNYARISDVGGERDDLQFVELVKVATTCTPPGACEYSNCAREMYQTRDKKPRLTYCAFEMTTPVDE